MILDSPQYEESRLGHLAGISTYLGLIPICANDDWGDHEADLLCQSLFEFQDVCGMINRTKDFGQFDAQNNRFLTGKLELDTSVI